ncbi:hypothetical protein J1614_009430 [Plenodomus biglobosus]|nr:hypothetical protein J1614_009430 [Plenodomus biglobosus]
MAEPGQRIVLIPRSSMLSEGFDSSEDARTFCPSQILLNENYLQLKGGEYVSKCCIFFTGECSSAIGLPSLWTLLYYQVTVPCYNASGWRVDHRKTLGRRHDAA